jgi:hypothetical protein
MLLFPKLILTSQSEDLRVFTYTERHRHHVGHLYLHKQTIQALVGGEAGLVVKCCQLRNVTADCYTVINLLVINM